MPSKFRKALYAVKDQTSISLAKVSSSGGGTNRNSIEVAILKATTHDNSPMDHRHVSEILLLISASKSNAAACAHYIAKRISRTRNWIVALKSLNIVLRIFQDGDLHFPREVLHVMKRGAKILNLSNFRDDSNSSPWDYTAFVRTFALYLDERLDCFLTGNLQKRFTQPKIQSYHLTTPRINQPIPDMKPATLIDRITYWQKLLDRAIATTPTGPAKGNRLVLHSVHAVVQESFDLYKDISDGLALLLDSFFHLQYQSCVNAFQACVKAAKQFEELGSFYDLCKSIGVGRTSEYPSVQQPSDELIETLQEFLKDQASFPCHGNRSLPLPPPSTATKYSDEQSESSEINSLGDIMSGTGSWNSIDHDGESVSDYQQSQMGDFANESNFGFFDEIGKPEETQFRSGDWELILAESATEPPPEWPDFFGSIAGGDLFSKPFSPQNHHSNPFLQDSFTIQPAEITPTFRAESIAIAPTFKAVNQNGSVFGAWDPNESGSKQSVSGDPFGFEICTENDPFGDPWRSDLNGSDRSFEVVNQESLLEQQKLWKEQQNKIIAKHLV